MMRNKFLFYFLILALAFIVSWPIWADDNNSLNINDSNIASFSDLSVSELNDLTAQKKKAIEELKKQSDLYEKNIEIMESEAVNLSNQLAILNNNIAKTQVDIKTAELEIDEVNLEIQNVELEINNQEKRINNQKEILSGLVRKIYQSDQENNLKILILNNSLSEFFNQANYLEETSKDLQKNLNRIKILKEQLQNQEKELGSNKQELETFKSQLENKKNNLDEELNAKNGLLAETKNSEQKFKKLLVQLKQQQDQINADIVDLEIEIRKKLGSSSIGSISSGLIWPVNPTRGISAYFHDPNYPFRYVFEHPAIDIRQYQGTPIKAAADGYVARAKDGGFGYSYVMLIHDQGIATVYGHVSKILVAENTYVKQGDIIALSGGMPGTPGAGPLTTGPHLHFEVRLNGIPVNPLDYLPVYPGLYYPRS